MSAWTVDLWDCNPSPVYDSQTFNLADPNLDNYSEDAIFRKSLEIDGKLFQRIDTQLGFLEQENQSPPAEAPSASASASPEPSSSPSAS
jgi:hypothetical protein